MVMAFRNIQMFYVISIKIICTFLSLNKKNLLRDLNCIKLLNYIN